MGPTQPATWLPVAGVQGMVQGLYQPPLPYELRHYEPRNEDTDDDDDDDDNQSSSSSGSFVFTHKFVWHGGSTYCRDNTCL